MTSSSDLNSLCATLYYNTPAPHLTPTAQLVQSARIGDISALQAALAAGADPNAFGQWALREAANHGHTEAVRLLIEAGAEATPSVIWGARATGHGHLFPTKTGMEA